MHSTPFNPKSDLPPLPFEDRHCQIAASLKQAGLSWTPHVGCFVWDRDRHLNVPSPFPNNIYFILNLGHFLRLLGSVDDLREKLIWMPTWHQARLLCRQLGIPDLAVMKSLSSDEAFAAGQDLVALYSLLLNTLKAETIPRTELFT